MRPDDGRQNMLHVDGANAQGAHLARAALEPRLETRVMEAVLAAQRAHALAASQLLQADGAQLASARVLLSKQDAKTPALRCLP